MRWDSKLLDDLRFMAVVSGIRCWDTIMNTHVYHHRWCRHSPDGIRWTLNIDMVAEGGSDPPASRLWAQHASSTWTLNIDTTQPTDPSWMIMRFLTNGIWTRSPNIVMMVNSKTGQLYNPKSRTPKQSPNHNFSLSTCFLGSNIKKTYLVH